MIIAIAGSKGGTGKTLVATNLALSLQKQNNIQFLDCDVEKPNAHIFLKPLPYRQEMVFSPTPWIDEVRCTYCGKCSEVCAYHAIAVAKRQVLVSPSLCLSCGACSYICPENAIFELGREKGILEIGRSGKIEFIHGRMLTGETVTLLLIRRIKEHIDPRKTVLIDVAPGISYSVLETLRGSDFCLLVTQSSPSGLSALVTMAAIATKLNTPYGVVINRDSAIDTTVEEYCLRKGIPVLLKIPLDMRIAHLYSQGIPLIQSMLEYREAFLNLFDHIQNLLRYKEDEKW
jgi:MinD superfamily P-loop ATPase